DLLILPVIGEPAFTGELDELDRRTGGELRALQAFGELKGKTYGAALGAPGDLPVRRVLAATGGKAEAFDVEVARKLAASALRRLIGRNVGTAAVWLGPIAAGLGEGEALAAELVARGIVEGSFEPKTIYREDSDAAPPQLAELVLIAAPDASTADVTAGATRGQIIGEGANIARRLANRAANDVTPIVLAEEARAIAEAHGLWIDEIDEHRAADLGMGMFLAVGQGSDNPPRMIVMRSGEEGAYDALGRRLAIIGKGVCFDSGGISIKPADRMEEMKMDKTGACTVIAAIATAARLAPGLPLIAVAPAVENMPGSHSTRPGDIVKALNGTFVDITNTDAEGRLILGDAMTYAESLGATHLIDVATLTGAVSRAFGNMVTGGFASEDSWWTQVEAAADRAGERYWRIPLIEDYQPELESWYGDVQNSGSAEGSLVKSGMFLDKFHTVPWVHLDIGGTGYYRKAYPFASRGACGVTHATLVELALAGKG
ncbi:MAG: M17 family peptidase N-terminal domain-containing protein, partial [Chloroflexota bacterium]